MSKNFPTWLCRALFCITFCKFRNEKLRKGCLQNSKVEDKILQPDCQRMKYGNVVNESSAKEFDGFFQSTLNKLYSVTNNIVTTVNLFIKVIRPVT